MRSLRLGIGLLAATAVTVTFALAEPVTAVGDKPTAIVSMGDSFISGEGGRWYGNSVNFTGSRDGTDRAYRYGLYDVRSVYGASFDNGCDRSDVAEIHSNNINVERKLNIACSGAQTQHLMNSASGGSDFKGERTQAAQLAEIAKDNDVRMIVLSVGGNDLEFRSQLLNCITTYIGASSTSQNRCAGSGQDALHAGLPSAMARVTAVIDDIQRVMANNGKAPGTYRVILQSYPAVLPRATEACYPENDSARTLTGGCPFWDADLNWFRDIAISQVADSLREVAAAKGVEFLDLQHLLQGREVCSTHSSLADGNHAPSGETSEWARFLTLGLLQGNQNESMHLNAYGQQAAGKCLELAYSHGRGNHTCHNTPGKGPEHVYLSAH